MRATLILTASTIGLIAGSLSCARAAGSSSDPDLKAIDTVVVIYAENRSFDNLYGNFPGADGLPECRQHGAHPARP